MREDAGLYYLSFVHSFELSFELIIKGVATSLCLCEVVNYLEDELPKQLILQVIYRLCGICLYNQIIFQQSSSPQNLFFSTFWQSQNRAKLIDIAYSLPVRWF